MFDNLPATRPPVSVRQSRRGERHFAPAQIFPDLNPIEMSFSRLKAHLRKAGERQLSSCVRRIGSIARNHRREAPIISGTQAMRKSIGFLL